MCLPFVCFVSFVRVTLVVLAAVCWYSNLCLSCVAACLTVACVRTISTGPADCCNVFCVELQIQSTLGYYVKRFRHTRVIGFFAFHMTSFRIISGRVLHFTAGAPF